MNIKNIFLTIYLIFIFTNAILGQDFISSDSSCTNSINFLKNNCYTCSKNDSLVKCKVEEFNYLGNINNKYYYYQIYLSYDSASAGILDSGYNTINLTIFEGNNSKSYVKPIYETGAAEGVFYYTKPELVNTKYGYIIHIYMSSGNGGWDFGDYFLLRNNKWYKLIVPEFSKILRTIIPKGDWFCRGSTVDLKSMTIGFFVYKKDDACCCPTGGSAEAKLKITANNHIKIISTKYYPNSGI